MYQPLRFHLSFRSVVGQAMAKVYCKRRRRRGSTSPPLTCIETNPGPKRAAKRRPSKKASPSSKVARYHSQEELHELKEKIESGQSLESIIAEGKFSLKNSSQKGQGARRDRANYQPKACST